jgi:hypothetical protein
MPEEEQARQRGPGEGKLPMEHVRATLSFAGLHQVTHELLKTLVVERLREFYGADVHPRANPYGRPRYKAEVLSLDPESYFRASLLWLVNAKAISHEQADQLDLIYAHRSDLARELLTYVVDPGYRPDVDLVADALQILIDIHRFWTQMAIDTGRFDEFGDVTAVDVQPAWGPVLWLCIEAVREAAEQG